MRITLAVAVACLSLGGIAAALDAAAAIRKSTDIPAQGLGPALTKLAEEFDFQVLYRTEVVSNLKSQPAVGALTSDEALGKVLSGTGLTYKYLDDKTVTIVPTSTAGSEVSTFQNASSGSSDDVITKKEAGKKSSQDFRVAQVDQGKNSNASSIAERDSSSRENSNSPSIGLSEIIVTAQKRSERLQDVPVPVTVVAADALLDKNLVDIQDYYSIVPGLNLGATIGGFYTGGSSIAIRGVNTGAGDPTVGFVVDDVQYDPKAAGFGVMPDIDPGELHHIEVLRGPQGTLYGADSMGGLVKYVTIDPSTDGVSGRLEATGSSVYNGNTLGYTVRAAANVPVSDTLAVRFSAFSKLEPGWIDDPIHSLKGVNQTEGNGGRLAALWKPSDVFSLKLSALFQYNRAFGTSETDIQPGLGDLQQSRIPGTGNFDAKTTLISATAKAKLGEADLTSITAVNADSFYGDIDFSYAVPTWTVPFNIGLHQFTEDLRLSMPLGSHIDWLIGGYYDHESNVFSEIVRTSDPNTGATTGFVESVYAPAKYTAYALYTDFTFHVTNRVDLQLGERANHEEQTVGQTGGPDLNSTANPVTYLVTPSFKISPDLMVYTRLASGYRPGGPNSGLANAGSSSYDADYTKNYELGMKGAFFNHSLSVDLSAYYIDWQKLQLSFVAPNQFGYTGNGSAAKSEGVEFSIEMKPLKGMTITGWVVYDDAVITKASPPGSATTLLPGDRLPFTSRWSAHLTADQEFPLMSGWTGIVGGDASYVGDRVSSVGTLVGTSGIYPSYVRLDLRASARYNSWTVNFFANNATDERGVIGGGVGTLNPSALYYIQPRTVGLSLVKTFP